ncbi:MAG: hypothetical protein ACPGIC_02395 [Opitutales bacterium]
MNDFDSFKASRAKVDPSARNMTEHQWQQAYAAYRSSRERLSGASRESGGASGRRRRSKSTVPSSARAPQGLMPTAQLRNEVRANSAYSDLRLLIDLLAWIAIGVVVLATGVKLVYYTNISAALVALLDAVVQVVAVLGLRLLAHVITDIPDIALHERLAAGKNASAEEVAGE